MWFLAKAQLYIPFHRALRRHCKSPPSHSKEPVCFESLYFFQNIKGLVSLDLTANPGGPCVPFTGLCPGKQAPLVFKLVRPGTCSAFSPFIFASLFCYSKVQQRGDEKKLGSLFL